MIEDIKIWVTKDLIIIPVDKREVERLTHTIILLDITSLFAEKITLKNPKILETRKKINLNHLNNGKNNSTSFNLISRLIPNPFK